ncbi:MAG: transposase, partial [Bacteroidota bacterium]
MKNTYTRIYGIDVSKDRLDIFLLDGAVSGHSHISNSSDAILEWIEGFEKEGLLCVLEHTGSYSSRLLHLLCTHGIDVSAVNPHRSSHFARALGIINKNDRNAAEALALMGRALDLPSYTMEKATVQKRRQVLRSLRALKKQRQVPQNQLHALGHQAIVQPVVKQAFEQTLETVNGQVGLLEGELDSLSD